MAIDQYRGIIGIETNIGGPSGLFGSSVRSDIILCEDGGNLLVEDGSNFLKEGGTHPATE